MSVTAISVEGIAQACHEANRAVQLATGDPAPSPHWDDAEEWQRDSAISGVKFALNGATPEQQHEEWCRDKETAGWSYGDVKDPAAKTHPCLVPYGQLPAGQKAKDALFVAIVTALAG